MSLLRPPLKLWGKPNKPFNPIAAKTRLRVNGGVGHRKGRMFGLFKSRPFTDELLGELRRSSGAWRGAINLGASAVPLVLTGTREAPNTEALAIARTVPSQYTQWQQLIESAMFQHYLPYAEAVAAGEPGPIDGLPQITQPQEVWPYAFPEYVSVTKLDGQLGVEIGYRVVWDDEHTLGARLQGGRLIELNGSVLRP